MLVLPRHKLDVFFLQYIQVYLLKNWRRKRKLIIIQ